MSYKLKDLITAIVEELSETQIPLEQLYALRLISTSVGVQLDGIGEIVGINRDGRDDANYKSAILFQIFVNISSGEPETLIMAFKNATDSGKVIFNEIFPASVELFGDGSVFPSDLSERMDLLAAGGVRVSAFSVPHTPFIWADEGISPNLDGKGYNEVSYTIGGEPVGGQYVELLS